MMQLPAELSSATAAERRSAFYRLLAQSEQLPRYINVAQSTTTLIDEHPERRTEITAALITLLDRENRGCTAASTDFLDDDHVDFYVNVITSVSSLVDSAAIPALIGALGQDPVAADGLAALGHRAIAALLAAQQSDDDSVRIGAIIALGAIARQHDADLAGQHAFAIRAALLSSLDDESSEVRTLAIEGLDAFPDEGVVDRMLNVATQDGEIEISRAANAWFLRTGTAWPETATSPMPITEPFYFTMDELRRSFALIVSDDMARVFASAWMAMCGGQIFEKRVVALPESFGFPSLDVRRDPHALDPSSVGPDVYDSLHGRRLLRFTPGTLTLIAGSDPLARARFDRIGLPYAQRTIDDPDEWDQLVTFLREP